MAQPSYLLTINTGSSSLKVALYAVDSAETLEIAASAERIDHAESRLRITDAAGAPLLDQQTELASHDAALHALLNWLRQNRPQTQFQAIGHRVVHGGVQYREPVLVTPDVLTALRHVVALAPDHLPQALAAIETLTQAYPTLPQVLCFDTAFHRHMPRVAQQYALPRRFWDAGVLRYGFHGLSYEYIMHELHTLDSTGAQGHVLIAHLGNGASMAAVRNGIGIDTTMGFTPTGGLVMGTRAGDLDPGVLLYALQAQGLDPAALSDLVNKQAGLLGVSASSADMQELLRNEATDQRAAEAITLFCYQAKKSIGALVAVLGGLDMLVFTGGIGEHAAPIRERICAGLEWLGIHLDPEHNLAHAPVISRTASTVVVRVMKTDEDRMIARHTHHLITEEGTAHV